MLELKKAELELAKVTCAKMEMELKIEEAHEAIKRLEDNIQNQLKRMAELEVRIQELKE